MEDRLYRLFGSRVRELREEKKYTQEELGKRVELSRTSITNIERGRQRVLLHQMVELADALETDLTELIPLKATKRKVPALRKDVAHVLKVLRSETETRS